MADAVRALAMDMVAAAGSGYPVMPLGMADAATALWTRAMRYDAADPGWADRDRFVLSAGHGSALLYALLHLAGYDGMGVEQLRGFRRLHSACAGHPERGEHPAIEATTGPLGQGLALGTGMALAERLLAARFGRSLVDHRTWVIASDGDLQEGVSHEAAALAGQLRLGRLTVLWDDNGEREATGMPGQLRRFAAVGWATKRIDGHDPVALASALSLALRSHKPTLIACRTVMGAAALGEKEALDWAHAPFEVPDELQERWGNAGGRGNVARRAWLRRLAKHPLRAEFERVMAGKLPDAAYEALGALRGEFAERRAAISTIEASRRALEALAPALPELVGGSADQGEATGTRVRGMGEVRAGRFGGRHVQYGMRQHGMAAALNGMAVHGGVIPFGATYLAFSDYQRPALRLAAMMGVRAVHVLTHDSIGLGEDGPTVQPVEQLASLRAMPGVQVLRPADGIETAECWELALREKAQPSLVVLSCQTLPAVRGDAGENRSAKGGYVLAEAGGARRRSLPARRATLVERRATLVERWATLIASGSEVALALAAREMLAEEGVPVAVVSLPCWELFERQDASYRAAVLGEAPRFGVEAAMGFGWERWLGPDGVFIGMSGFGASAPGAELYQHFGITPEAIAQAVRRKLGQLGSC